MAIDLATIKRGRRLKPPKVVIYGVGGIGKSTWPSAAPNPVYLCTEEGIGSLDVPRFEPRENDPVLRSWNEILEAVAALYTEPHEFGTVVLDSLDFAEPLLWDFTAKKHGKEDIEAFGYGKGYIAAVDEARVLLQGLDALRNDRGMAIVLIAHSDTKRFEDPTAEAYDRYVMRLHARLGNLVHDWADAVLFATWRAHVVKDKEAFNKERRRAVGRGERILYTEERPAWWAKNRYGLPTELPLSWAAFEAALVAPQPEPVTETETETEN